MEDMKKYLRELPAVHELQKEAQFREIATHYHMPASQLTEWIQEEINALREKLLVNEWDGDEPSSSLFSTYLFEKIQQRARLFSSQRLRRVINGTGVVLHTNFGRARISERAVHAAEEAAVHYTNLEFDLEQGERGSRHSIVESLICQVTGAESAMVVNNNAAAVYLTLRGLTRDQEVLVSRGELVEIGGSFRVSAIMEESGARLVEVGTTNKTHLYDYTQAVSERTAMIMKVHTSNFKMNGFTDSVDTENLVEWAANNELMTYEDLGSGAFYDFSSCGIGEEPFVRKVIDTNIDIVTCSGDKLLGGPQAGIIAGKKEYVDALKAHQLARVLRVDKITLAALEATLQEYTNGRAQDNVPTVRDIVASEQEIRERTTRFIDFMASASPSFYCKAVSDHSQVGGGTMPDVFLPTCGAIISHDRFSAQKLTDALRQCDPPVITRIKERQVYIDFRTIENGEIEALISAFRQLDSYA